MAGRAASAGDIASPFGLSSGGDHSRLWFPVPRTGQDTRDAHNAKAAAEVAAKRESEEAEQQRVAAVKAEQERRARAEVEAKAKPTMIRVGF
jgi:hypothetical protein